VKDVGLNYWTKGRGKKRGGSIADRVLYEGKRRDKKDMPYLKGRDVARYEIAFSNHWLMHDYEKRLSHQDTFRFSPDILNQEKIVYRQTSDRIVASLEQKKMLTDKTLHSIVLRDNWKDIIDLRFILGILNSLLMNYLYVGLSREEGRTFAQAKVFRMKQMPIPDIFINDDYFKHQHEHMVSLVEQMMTSHTRLMMSNTPSEKASIQRRINATDRKIDQLVYALYELTNEEISIVEEAFD
jgi:hypothetical protein